MTAIAGYWRFDGGGDPAGRCRQMLAAMTLYGPDASDTAAAGPLALGRNLYRLLPEDAHDAQPLFTPDGRHCLVADLRIDNRGELAAALTIGAAEAAAMADSALLLRALRQWGIAALDRLLGDYAFAWFDSAQRELVLARDPLGQRPLFWHRGGGFLAFSSMPKGLHALEEVARAPDPESLARFVGRVPQRGARSFYRDVQRVEPGHFVTFTASGEQSHLYWKPVRRDLGLKSFDDYVAAYRAELDRAVACRLRGADGLVATHLSGGWDSGAVTATAARLLAPAGGRVVAFTSVPAAGAASAPARKFADEGPAAAATAAMHANIEHVLVESGNGSPLAGLARQPALFERPLYNICNHVWLSQIRTAAREKGARVLLSGEIGNWTISAGPVSALADLVRERRWGRWAREARAMLRKRRARLRGIAASSFGAWVPAPLWRLVRNLSARGDPLLESAVHPDYHEAIARERARSGGGLGRPPKDSARQAVAAMRAMDYGELRKGILAGWGLDKRDPTADRRLIEFCLSLPVEMLLADGVRRPLARAALADRLPAAVLDETRKGYQASDWHVGLTADRAGVAALVEEIAADPAAAGVIDIGQLRALVRDWPVGGWEEARTVARYRTALLHALSAGRFVLDARR
ncbi:MAG: asparagine synthetase B family protein [Allosphingosinicella sp.]